MILRFYRIFIQVLCVPIFLSEFFRKETGREYGLGFWAKMGLVFKVVQNNFRILSGSSFLEHLTMATTLLQLPRSLEGGVVECGTYKGVSAANLSLVCKIVHRRLHIFDSFEGLPEPSNQDKGHLVLGQQEIHTYSKGSWCGSLEEVKRNISQCGEISVCVFHRGYFKETLPPLHEKCVLVWLDVDYRDSLETCLKYLWPLLEEGCRLYTHEAGHREIASLFFSEKWWGDHLKTSPPGLVGAGTGIGLKILTGSYFNSSLGYAVKNPRAESLRDVPQLGGMKLNLRSSLKLTEQPKTSPRAAP